MRVKVGRRLQSAGALPLRNSAYLLPDDVECRERLDWLRSEIIGDGGQAWICRVAFLAGDTSETIAERFRASRGQDYAGVLQDLAQLDQRARTEAASTVGAELTRLRRRALKIHSVDFFDAGKDLPLDAAFFRIEEYLNSGHQPGTRPELMTDRAAYARRQWVTRPNIFVDRMASAWLIRRFIDPDATIEFITEGHAVPDDAVTFDTPGGTFSHEGDQCTFEVLRGRFALRDPALATLAEIVHDIDCGDEKFSRAESPGLELVLRGIRARGPTDADRLRRSAAILDDLYVSLGGI